ncbi:hypothetical protein [Bacillus weihaiensis]|uniref:hypothetical protein n=1 Tax=Bacillus weihaiensis TaxID=1547283 RepID=UPI0023534D22|nr:hypothetical protein [Bacillus weihaiensis]
MGAIFEKYFDLVGEDQAEKVAYGMQEAVEKHKAKLLNIIKTSSYHLMDSCAHSSPLKKAQRDC